MWTFKFEQFLFNVLVGESLLCRDVRFAEFSRETTNQGETTRSIMMKQLLLNQNVRAESSNRSGNCEEGFPDPLVDGHSVSVSTVCETHWSVDVQLFYWSERCRTVMRYAQLLTLNVIYDVVKLNNIPNELCELQDLPGVALVVPNRHKESCC